ncbi:MAG: class I SAM-dependent methyltransferase [Pyrinomonadaceae bacterium]
MEQISDNEWFEANLNPEIYRAKLGIAIPDLPPDEVQMRFTGRTGRENLQQAFDFYKFVLENLPKLDMSSYTLLDFGGGWGRILRLFLREFQPQRLFMLDAMKEAVEYARSLNPPFVISQCHVRPPLSMQEGSIGLCYAFSVFSHLAEQECSDWLRHFAYLLVPRGKLIITTRGKSHIDYLETLDQKNTPYLPASLLPRAETIRKVYESSAFQFYPTGGGGELSQDFYGETWIPKRWLEERYASFGFSSCEFYPEFKTVDQCVFVLTK